MATGAEKGAGSQRGSRRETERQKGSCNRQRQSYCMDNEQSTQSLLLVSLFCLLPGFEGPEEGRSVGISSVFEV